MKLTATLVLHGVARSGQPLISVAGSPVAPGSQVPISVSGGPGNRTDWIAIAGAGSPDGSVITWAYLSGTQSAPPAGMSSATIRLTAPTSGMCEARLYLLDGYSVLARSAFAVQGAGPPPPPPPPPSSPPPPPPPPGVPPAPPAPLLTVTPVHPSITDTTPRGTVVATYAVRMSDGSAFTGSVRFGFPNFDHGGVFALASMLRLNGVLTGDIIINPVGPGVGPNTTSKTDHITLETIP